MSEVDEAQFVETYAERRAFPEDKKGGYGEVWFLAYPAVLTMLSQTLMSFTDAVMVGRLGPVQLASVGLAGTIVWGFFAFFNGLVSGVNTFVAQDFGAKEYRGIGKMTWQGIYLAVLSGIVMASMSVFSPVFFRLLGPSPDVQLIGTAFLRIRLLGGGFMVSWMCFSAFLRGLGDTRTPLKIALVANGINIVANYCLIFGKLGFPRLGANGSALGTVFATAIGTAMFVGVFLSKKNADRYATRADWRPDLRALRRLVRISVPIGVQWFLDQGSFVVFSAVIGRISTMGLAASEATLRLMSLSFMPMVGLSIAATTLVGQYIGSKEIPCSVRSGKTAMKLGLIYAAFIAVLFAVFPGRLISAINSSPEVIRIGTTILRMAALFQIFDCLGIISSGCLRGAGDTRWTMVVSMTCAWLVFVPLAYIGGFVLKGGAIGAWAGATAYI
ncbi:MAG TPA: MATE family efflux transporter, partial [bacterium]|nr:MATE family efflux transporter [bacterium]